MARTYTQKEFNEAVKEAYHNGREDGYDLAIEDDSEIDLWEDYGE